MPKIFNQILPILLSLTLLLISDVSIAAGETCSDAWQIGALPYNASGPSFTTCGSVQNYSACNTRYNYGTDVVFKFTPTASNNCISIELLMQEQNGVQLFVTENCPDAANVNCIAQTYQSSIYGLNTLPVYLNNIPLEAGKAYFIIIKALGHNYCDDFDLKVTAGSCSPVSTGDNCTTAEPITKLPFSSNNTTCGQPDSFISYLTKCSTQDIGPQYYYTYTPLEDECISIEALSIQTNLTLRLYENCPTSFTSLCIATLKIVFGEKSTGAYNLRANKSYYFGVYYEGVLTSCSDFEISIDYVNEEGTTCQEAIPITDAYFHDNDQSTKCKDADYTYSNTCLKNLGLTEDIVYKYTSPGNECIQLSLKNTSSGGYLFFLDNCPDNRLASCDKFYFYSNNELNQEIEITNPSDYYIIIAGTSPSLTFDFTLISSPNNIIGTNCSDALDISNPALPITASNLSTICKESFESTACNNAINTVGSYYIKYTAAQDFCGTISINNIFGYGGFAIFSECPTSPTANCLGSIESNVNSDSLWLDFNFVDQQTYYFLVYTNSESSYFFDFTIQKAFNTLNGCYSCETELCEECHNTDFETNSFENWEGAYGTSYVPNSYQGFSEDNNDSWYSRHSIIKAGSYDRVVGPKLKTVSPAGGRLAVKLGNSLDGSQGEQLSYSMKVTENNHNFFYNYAVVLEDPSGSHAPEDQPYFSVKILTEDEEEIECANYEVRTSTTDGLFNEQYSLEAGAGLIFWKDWSLVAVPLKDYIGQNVKIIFTTLDCGLGAHFGYAYIDAFCLAPEIIKSSDEFFCALDTISLIAPKGYKNYVWDSGETTKDIQITKEGYYRVTAYSYGGCVTYFDINVSYTSGEHSIKLKDEFLCHGDSIKANINNFNITISSWEWDMGDINKYSDNEFTHVYDTTGKYEIIITLSTDSGCYVELEKTVSVYEISLAVDSIRNIICFGDTNGYIEFSVDTGINPYQYFLDEIPIYGNTLSNLDTGTYTISVIDSVGCYAETTYQLIGRPELLLNELVSNLKCYEDSSGSIEVIATGGTQPYQYQLNNGLAQANNTFNGLAAGNYIITVVDQNNCLAEKEVIITQPDSLALDLAAVNLRCNNDSTGEITATASGGTQPYQYQLNNGLAQANNTFNGLAAGNYIITVVDQNNCLAEKEVIITQPDSLALDLAAVNLRCNNDSTGEITATASGGTQPYQYQLNNGLAQANNTFNGLVAGNYIITIIDQNNCTTEKEITITQPDSIVLNIASTNLLCYRDSIGEIIGNAIGGTPPYRFYLNNGLAQSNGTFTNLPAMQHNIKLIDSVGCTVTSNINITQPDSLSINLLVTQLSCSPEPDGLIVSNVNGGTKPYLFSLDNTKFIANNSYDSLPEGNYTVYVIDKNDCRIKANTTLIAPEPAVFDIERINIAPHDSLICGPKQAFYRLNITSGSLVDCEWQFGDGSKNYTCQKNVSHWYYQQGLFDVTFRATDENGCFQTKKLQEIVTVHNKSIADFEINPVQASDLDNYVSIIDKSIHAETQEWIVNASPWHYTPHFELDHVTTEYTFTQITKTKYHCNDSITKVLPIIPSLLVNIPNTFTPDGNNDNDIFRPIIYNGDKDTYLFEIYDRWGELVFQTTEQNIGWDGTYKGKPAKSDSYIYVVVVKNIEKTKTEVYRDFVNLLR